MKILNCETEFLIEIYIDMKKVSTTLLVVMIGLAVVIVLSTCLSCKTVVPYNSDPKYTRLDKEGFTNLKYGTYPKGDLTEQCMLNSNGMSNSQGYLCLDQQQIKLLTTRGGNQTPC